MIQNLFSLEDIIQVIDIEGYIDSCITTTKKQVKCKKHKVKNKSINTNRLVDIYVLDPSQGRLTIPFLN